VTEAPATSEERLWGLYRGTVENNIDPLQLGRVQVSVAGVDKTISTWAMPCVPVAGSSSGAYAVPTIGASVWIVYEGGDTNYPVWLGGFWLQASDRPPLAQQLVPALDGLVLQTRLGNGLLISDAPGPAGGIVLKIASGAQILINDVGITISNGKGAQIMLTANSVQLNNDALVVM
jgi:uncharacterized protein involved in type VI secretion and phage assembly